MDGPHLRDIRHWPMLTDTDRRGSAMPCPSECSSSSPGRRAIRGHSCRLGHGRDSHLDAFRAQTCPVLYLPPRRLRAARHHLPGSLHLPRSALAQLTYLRDQGWHTLTIDRRRRPAGRPPMSGSKVIRRVVRRRCRRPVRQRRADSRKPRHARYVLRDDRQRRAAYDRARSHGTDSATSWRVVTRSAITARPTKTRRASRRGAVRPDRGCPADLRGATRLPPANLRVSLRPLQRPRYMAQVAAERLRARLHGARRSPRGK